MSLGCSEGQNPMILRHANKEAESNFAFVVWQRYMMATAMLAWQTTNTPCRLAAVASLTHAPSTIGPSPPVLSATSNNT